MSEFKPDRIDIAAAEKLQEIFVDILGRPLTQEEKARTHQHVATVNAIFDKAKAS